MPRNLRRNLVVCIDGTANKYGTVNTNVVHLYERLVNDDDRQLTLYEPGVGTFSSTFGRTVGGAIGRTLGKLFGHGLTENIENGYRFLMRHYQPGDTIYLFGFSRGAYAVRALAGMVRKCGLLKPSLDNLAPYASRLYLEQDNDDVAAGFRETYAREAAVYCIGVWDTVKSLGYLYTRDRFFNDRLAPDVTHGYHALAIDERRPKFEARLWDESRKADHQTIEQVWFAGAHADVGGGYDDRALAEVTLQWMLDRATACGLHVRDIDPPQPADPTGTAHDSLATASGRILQLTHLGARPRTIEPGALVHKSVDKRRRAKDYNPEVLPAEHSLIT